MSPSMTPPARAGSGDQRARHYAHHLMGVSARNRERRTRANPARLAIRGIPRSRLFPEGANDPHGGPCIHRLHCERTSRRSAEAGVNGLSRSSGAAGSMSASGAEHSSAGRRRRVGLPTIRATAYAFLRCSQQSDRQLPAQKRPAGRISACDYAARFGMAFLINRKNRVL